MSLQQEGELKYKATLFTTTEFDQTYLDRHDGRVMPPQQAATIMYTNRMIANVNTALQGHQRISDWNQHETVSKSKLIFHAMIYCRRRRINC